MAVDHNDSTKKIQGWNVVEAKQLDDLDPQERVDLDVDKFARLLKQKGVRVKVYRSMYCPQVKSIDGSEHEIDCQLCNGSGYIDLHPINTLGFIQNQDLEKIQLPEGWVDGNSVSATFPIGIELQYFTLVELLDFNDIFYEKIVRSNGDMDRLKYRAQRINVLFDQNGVEWFCGRDFKLNDQGDLLWKNNKGPDPQTIYSIHYEYPVRFRAITAQHVNRFTQIKTVEGSGGVKHMKLPEQWMLTKEFLVLRRDKDGKELLSNPIPGYDEETPSE